MAFEAKQPTAAEQKDDLDGLDLQPATFSSFQPQGAQNWMSVEPATFPSFGGSSYNSFQEPDEVFRSLDPSGGNLSAETYRAVETSSFSGQNEYNGGGSGGFVIGNEYPSFNLDPKTHQTYNISSTAQGYASATKNKIALSEAVIQRAEPQGPPGGYLEPSYHFFSSANPTALIQSILALLSNLQVDCTPKHEQFKIKCAAYRSCARLSFYVHVFAVDAVQGLKRYAIEFQRRTGDALHFSEIYRASKRGLSEQHLIEKVKGATVRTETPAPPPLDAVITVDQVRQTVKSLLMMVTSKCLDLKTQAIVTLADMTAAEPKVQKMMVDEGVLDALVDELSTSSADIHRCAVTGIANLAHERDSVCTKLQEIGAIKTLLALAKSEVPQVVRETARLLANIGTTLGTKVVDTEFRATLKSIRGGRDMRARQHISALAELLGI
jgi:hypothetical protein